VREPRLATKTFAALFAVAAVAIGVIALSSVLAMRRLYVDATLEALGQTAAALANDSALSLAIASGDGKAVDAAGDRIAAGTRLRVSIVAPDGRVLGDSASDTLPMDNHALRPEIAEAFQGRPGTSMRRSTTLGIEMAYAASPISTDGRVTGVLRVAMGAPDILQGASPFIVMSMAVAVAMIAAIGATGARFGALVTEPVNALIEAASHWSAGRLERRLKRFDDPELTVLADTMNSMASDLSARIQAAGRHQRELGAILDSMDEAVLSIDADYVVRLANPKAIEVLCRNGDNSKFMGRTVLQATGNVALDELARRCAESGIKEEAEITLYNGDTRHLLVHAAPLPLESGRTGLVIVLDDISRLKRLERVRKDFVANVSHELRTPITLIKGFAETLETVDTPEESARFLVIIRRHADRMASIIEDLLTLARLESPERGQLETKPFGAHLVLARAAESLGDRASDKGIGIDINAEETLVVEANEGLLEQALLNLMDNAVKYSPRGSSIRAEAGVEGDYVRFAIIDNGPGIPLRDQSRLFERFYRVDRARSRELGGTGLGLAIVRHIALAHGGDASVESLEGAGSTFIVRIPLHGGDGKSVQLASPDPEMPTVNS
jgi:two-component system phosphate regulon sensor histidine kinase PhoR